MPVNPKASRERELRIRVADRRVICSVHDDEITILVIEIGHRSHIYQAP